MLFKASDKLLIPSAKIDNAPLIAPITILNAHTIKFDTIPKMEAKAPYFILTSSDCVFL